MSIDSTQSFALSKGAASSFNQSTLEPITYQVHSELQEPDELSEYRLMS